MDTIYHAFDIRKHEFVELIHAWQHRLNVPQLPPGYRTAKQAFDDLEAALEALQADLGTRCTISGGEPTEFGSPQWFADIDEIPF